MTPRPREAEASLPGALAPALTLVLTLGIAGLHWLLNPRFFYWDDMQHAIVPVFRNIGARLLAGDWPSITLLSWQSGNLVGEGQYQLFNPVSLALFPVLASIDDLSIAAAVYSTTYLLIAAGGAHFLASRLGALPLVSSAVGLAYATSPFLLYWLAGSWTNGLASMAFLPWALGCLAGQRITRPALLGLFASSYLLAVSGWIHGLFALALYGCLALWSRRNSWTVREITATLGAMGAGGLLAGPQLIATLHAVAAGTRASGVASSGVLTLEPQAMLAGSMLPAYFGRLRWGPSAELLAGGAIPAPPIAYCAWFVILAIAIWFRRRSTDREGLWLLIGALVLGVLMLGPEQLGPMRWPVRFLPAFCLGLCAWAATQLTPAATADRTALRPAIAIIAIAAWLSWQQAPDRWPEITVWALLVGLACYAALVPLALGRSRPGVAAHGSAILLMSALVSVGFAITWPSNQNLPDWNAPAIIGDRQDATGGSLSSTLQVYSYSIEGGGLPDAADMLHMPSGNVAMLSGRRHVNGYTPIGPAGLSRLMCSNPFGWTCDLLLPRFFREVPTTGSRLVDLMGIDTIKVQDSKVMAKAWLDQADGWRLAQASDGHSVYVRQGELPMHGTVTYLAPGIVHERTEAVTDDQEIHRLVVDSAESDRLIVFARAWYPGYAARWNDEQIDTFALDRVLTAVRLPAGDGTGRLVLSHSVFNSWLAVATLAAGCLLLFLSLFLLRNRPAK